MKQLEVTYKYDTEYSVWICQYNVPGYMIIFYGRGETKEIAYNNLVENINNDTEIYWI
ncbi:MAG: hypothetical protein ACM3O3_12940 [Syntrophothermus sp.]